VQPFTISQAQSPGVAAQASTAYQQAGVNLKAARSLVTIAKRLAKTTTRPDIKPSALGGFGGAFELPAGYRQPLLVAGCDGVGTKLELARLLNRWDTVGQDLVAMSVNDLLVQGAEPLVFLDYMATGQLSLPQFEAVLSGVAEGCRQSNCTLIGGETAEMPGAYTNGQVDLAGFALGVVEKSQMLPRLDDLGPNTVLIGLTSSGLHSNGYSLVRKLLLGDRQIPLTTVPQGANQDLATLLMAPTTIYVKPVLDVLKQMPGAVQAMVHVTGGGFYDNIPRVLPDHLQAEMNPLAWDWPVIFHYLQELGDLSWETMFQTFNCGIGYILMVDKTHEQAVKQHLNTHWGQHGMEALTIGKLVANHDVTGDPALSFQVG
jgi:phosphoribosylformylglycinamidine cyclo-ligase